VSQQAVVVFYQSDVKFGGWPTGVTHTVAGLRACGKHVVLARAGASKQRTGDFGRGLPIEEVPLHVAVAWARTYPSFVAVSAPKQADMTLALVEAGAGLVVHDPTEWKGGCLDATFAAMRLPVVVHRRTVHRRLQERGVPSVVVPHPYQPVGLGAGQELLPLARRTWQAAAISRVDFDKRTHLVAEANTLLPADKRIAIHGAMNRIYEYHQLRKLFPEWRREYHGPFTSDSVWAGFGVAQQARTCVDMSVIVGDGGGTQMTFFEALDAGCALVLNAAWRTGDAELDEMDGLCRYVSSAQELADAVLEPEYPSERAVRELLANHAAQNVGRQLLGVLGAA